MPASATAASFTRIALLVLAGLSPPAMAQSADAASASMGWVQGQRFSAGLGLQRAATTLAPRALDGASAGSADAAVLVGVGVNLGQGGSSQPRLSWQAPIATMNGSGHAIAGHIGIDGNDGNIGEPRPQGRVGLSFNSQDRYAALRRAGALKLELNSQTALAIKPRRGKFSVTLMSQW